MVPVDKPVDNVDKFRLWCVKIMSTVRSAADNHPHPSHSLSKKSLSNHVIANQSSDWCSDPVNRRKMSGFLTKKV